MEGSWLVLALPSPVGFATGVPTPQFFAIFAAHAYTAAQVVGGPIVIVGVDQRPRSARPTRSTEPKGDGEQRRTELQAFLAANKPCTTKSRQYHDGSPDVERKRSPSIHCRPSAGKRSAPPQKSGRGHGYLEPSHVS